MTEQKTITASKAKLHFGEILNQCVYGKQEIIVTKHNKSLAVIIPFEQWQEKKKKEESDDDIPELHKKVLLMREDIKKRIAKGEIKPPKYTSVELCRMVREENDKRLERQIQIAEGKYNFKKKKEDKK